MSAVGRQRVAVAAGVRSFLREPTNVVLLVVLPPAVLVAFDLALDPLGAVPGFDISPAAAELGGALFATAFLAGLLGVFQGVSTADVDRRLVVCGYAPVEVLAARLLTVLLAGTLVAAITYVTFRLRASVAPAAPVAAFAVLVLAAALYGLVGVLVGVAVGRELEGSLLLVFLADFDAFNAIGVVPTESDLLAYLPLATPADMLEDAIYEGTVAAGDVAVALGYVVVFVVATTLVVSWWGDLA